MNLIVNIKNYFITFTITEHFLNGGGPQFTSHQFQQFLKSWGVKHRTRSSYFSKLNLRNEIVVNLV